MDCHNSEDEDDIACGDCDYTISQGEFDSGKGRIMFNDVNEEGTEYRCGCCDDRVADPMGMFPDDEPPAFSDGTVQEVFRQLMDEGKLESRVNEETGMVEFRYKMPKVSVE